MSMIDDYVSLRGTRHIVNQDHGCIHHYDNNWLMVVSDGLGSKKKSQLGSYAVCEAAQKVFFQSDTEDIFFQPEQFMTLVHQEWLQQLEGENIDDCSATVLILALLKNRGIAIQLGDGFISILADGMSYILLDDKTEHYINETDCFEKDFDPSLLRYTVFDFDFFQCALLCSDGVEIGEMTKLDIEGFSRNFYDSFRELDRGTVKHKVRQWLKHWPGSDDKTTVYLISQGDSV